MATATLPPLMRSDARRMDAKAEDLMQRYKALKQQRLLHEFDWQDLVYYLSPGSDDVIGNDSRWPMEGSRTSQIYDSHPTRAPQILAANIMGTVTNQAIQWRRLKFREETLNDIQAVTGWLQQCDKRIMGAYGSSNFYQAAHTYYHNLGTFGTAAMYAGVRLQAKGAALHFKTLSTGAYCIAENADGLVDTLYRDLWLTPRQALQAFEGQVSPEVQRLSRDQKKMDEPRLFVHCAEPREEYNREKYDNKNMPFAGWYFEYDTKKINDETGYHEFPFLVSRWETLSRSPYGFAPGHVALPDVRMLHMLRQLNIQQLALWVQPPLEVEQEAIIGNISLDGLAQNFVKRIGSIKPLDLTGRPDLVQINQEDLRRSIDDSFYVNALQALPPPDASNMTAYEVAQRIELMTRTMGPVFYRLLAEFLTPLEDRVFGIAWRAGALPPPPQEVLRAAAQSQGQLDVDYFGPLARAQRGEEIRSLQDYMALTAKAIETQQSTDPVDLFDWDAGLRDAAEVLGLQAYRRDVAAYTRMRQARAQQQQQMQQAQMQNERLQSMGRVAPLISAVQQPAQAMAA